MEITVPTEKTRTCDQVWDGVFLADGDGFGPLNAKRRVSQPVALDGGPAVEADVPESEYAYECCACRNGFMRQWMVLETRRLLERYRLHPEDRIYRLSAHGTIPRSALKIRKQTVQPGTSNCRACG